MAESLAFGLVQNVLQNLGNVVLQEIGGLWGLDDDLDRLRSTLTTICSVLEDAELKQRKIPAVRVWLGMLKDAADDAEDILALVATHGLKRRLDREIGNTRELKAYFSLQNPLVFRVKIAHKMKNIRKRLEEIAKERHDFGLAVGEVSNSRIDDTLESRQTSSFVNDAEIYGRKDERNLIVEKLVPIKDRELIHGPNDLSVYAICGMGGLGKTTLAQLVYNDDTVKGHFELRIWVCVSDDFSTKRLFKAIIESIGDICPSIELDPMQRFLQEKLTGKRYLLVLDDVWSEQDRLWDRLKEALRCGAKGSVVMVTTRIEKVATMMDATYIHRLRCLSSEESWLLFKRRAFATEDGENGEFRKIGEKIVERCGGVPLAVKALGSLMRSRSTQNEWLEIEASELWQLSDEDNGILPALKLSYDNLTPRMRQCFAYCCIFPKDSIMCEDELVRLWIANGFVCSVRKENLPSAARRIFKELVWRSFFQNVQRDSQGKVECQMHDLMHDLAELVMRHETYIVQSGKDFAVPKKLRHLSFEGDLYEAKLSDRSMLKLPKSLRSFYGKSIRAFRGHQDGVSFILSQQRYLRVLFLENLPKKFPSILCKLELLTYLAMSCEYLKRLPESIIRLTNLQTLKLTQCESLTELHKDLKYLRNLYFLEMDSWSSLVCTPPGLGEMTCLQELSIFIVGQESAHQINQLKDLNLGGYLSIKGLENVRSLEDAKRANLTAKVNMKSLELSWSENSGGNLAEYEDILEGLEPNRNIEKININLYPGIGFPKWMSTLNFNNLYEITLESCRQLVRIPPFGKLPSLASLNLNGLISVKRLDAEWGGDGSHSFPALKRLIIDDMPSLEEWIIQESVTSFACLTDLQIMGCPKLIALPTLDNPSTLRTLAISGCSNLEALPRIPHSLESLEIFGCDSLTSIPATILEDSSLTRLNIHRCKKLKYPLRGALNNTASSTLQEMCISECPEVESLPESIQQLTALTQLSLSGCLNLEVLQRIPHSLESLEIFGCDSLTSIPATILEGSSLTSLWIRGCKKLKYLLSGALNNTASSTLKELRIEWCPEVESLPESIQQLTALTQLSLSDCPNLEVLQRIPHSLESLTIDGCDSLTSIPATILEDSSIKFLQIWRCKKMEYPLSGALNNTASSTLKHLTIFSCPEVESLPESIQQLTALTEMTIGDCSKLCDLPSWLRRLRSLEVLRIGGCEKLEFLPDGIQSLKSLRYLDIDQCPVLESRCAKPNGVDWPKISHIPQINLGGRGIQYQ